MSGECNDCRNVMCICDEKEKEDEAALVDLVGAKLHSTMDANVWAEEFMRINRSKMSGETDVSLDTMRAWFANAIMAGYDIAHQRLNEEANYHKDETDIPEVVESKECFGKWHTALLLSNISHDNGKSGKPHPLSSCLARDLIRDRHVKNAMYKAFEKYDPYGCFKRPDTDEEMLSKL